MKKMVVLSEKEEKVKLSPYTAEKMARMGNYSTSQLLEDSEVGGERRLVAVDLIQGSPVERVLSEGEVKWLKGVAYQFPSHEGYQECLGL